MTNKAFWVGLEYQADGQWHLWQTVTIIGDIGILVSSPYFIAIVFEALVARFISADLFIPNSGIRQIVGVGIKNQIDAPDAQA